MTDGGRLAMNARTHTRTHLPLPLPAAATGRAAGAAEEAGGEGRPSGGPAETVTLYINGEAEAHRSVDIGPPIRISNTTHTCIRLRSTAHAPLRRGAGGAGGGAREPRDGQEAVVVLLLVLLRRGRRTCWVGCMGVGLS